MILVLLIAALILLFLAAIGVPSRVGLGWLGMAVWLLVTEIAPRIGG